MRVPGFENLPWQYEGSDPLVAFNLKKIVAAGHNAQSINNRKQIKGKLCSWGNLLGGRVFSFSLNKKNKTIEYLFF